MARILRVLLILGCTTFVASCAYLHSVMLSDVESRRSSAKKIDFKVSETTIDFQELARLGKSLGEIKKAKDLVKVSEALDTYTMLFQWGPRTGAPVFNAYYARAIPEMLQAKCPGGHLSDIVSIRESREYPVVKGEIIRVQALCHASKGRSS